ncbi:hypothetical protein LOZ66_005260 [Ophidiomyces ophidiicola]|nr:hypothetical protein LOZ66_005260 [Ophidiomyces ophidiicola]
MGLLPDIKQDCAGQMTGVLLPELKDASFAGKYDDLSPQNLLMEAQYNVKSIND